MSLNQVFRCISCENCDKFWCVCYRRYRYRNTATTAAEDPWKKVSRRTRPANLYEKIVFLRHSGPSRKDACSAIPPGSHRECDMQTRCKPQINTDKEQANRKPAGAKRRLRRQYTFSRQPSQTSRWVGATTARLASRLRICVWLTLRGLGRGGRRRVHAARGTRGAFHSNRRNALWILCIWQTERRVQRFLFDFLDLCSPCLTFWLMLNSDAVSVSRQCGLKPVTRLPVEPSGAPTGPHPPASTVGFA